MDELKWTMLAEVFGRMDAELIQSYLAAHGIDTELFQEAYQSFTHPIMQGRVQIFVPTSQLKLAQKLYEESGWEFEITEDDDESFEEEDE